VLAIDRAMAERTIASLPLGNGTRRFAEWWLAHLGSNETELDDDIESCTLSYEVRPGQDVICRASGARIDQALGISLCGRNMLEMVPPERRATALARYENVAAGGLQFSLRRVVEAGGDAHLLQEIGVPDPRDAPRPPGAVLSLAYVDVNALEHGTRIDMSEGALELADTPLFADLRPSPRLFQKEAARGQFSRLHLTVKNRTLANYWLSLWKGDELPRRGDFQPGRVSALVGGICHFEVRPNESVFCRSAGSSIRSALGFNISNSDWLAQTDPYQRATRLRGFSDVALGIAAVTKRRVNDTSGKALLIEGLMLPFADVETGGTRYVLTHDDWRPTEPAGHFAQLHDAKRVASEFRAVRLG